MVDASGLVYALGRDELDQREVAVHLMSLAKGIKNRIASAATLTPAEEQPGSPIPTPSGRASNLTTPQREEVDASAAATTIEAVKQETEEQHGDRGDEGGSVTHEQPAEAGADLVNEQSERQQPSGVTEPRDEQVKDKAEIGGDLLLQLIRSFRGGMLRVDTNLRAAMFRAVRYLVRTSEDAKVIRRQRFGLFIALALAREQYELWERMQALKLVKQIMAVDSSWLPREVVRTVVAVSGHKEDNFRRVCLETLQELAMANPRMVAHANGFRVLLAAAIDPANQDLVDPLVTSLMAIVEDPMTRRYVRPRLELHQLLTGFTDLDAPPGPDQAHRWKGTRRALVVAMRSWAGVHVLASDSRGLVTLMRLLRDPSASFSEDSGLQDSILDTIIEVFHPLMGMDRSASTADVENKPRGRSFEHRLFTPFPGSTATLSQKSVGAGLRTRKGSEPHNLLLSYATILCAAYVHCGLIPSLTTLSISAGSEELRTKAATLLVDVLHLCAMLLSQNQCTRLLSMPGLVQIAAESQTGSMMAATEGEARACHLARSRASRASDLIRLLHGALGAGGGRPITGYFGQQSQTEQHNFSIGGLIHKVYEADFSADKICAHRSPGWEQPAGNLEQMRRELRSSFESTVEKSVMDTQINKSKVLATKDWTKWDWDVVDDIVRDTLPHPARLIDALRTKWIKRVSGFYRFVGAGDSGTSTDRGGGGGLHNMAWDPDHIRHVGCAGRLYSLLLQRPEGVHFLQTDARGGILQEIVKELQALVTRRWSSEGGSGRSIGSSKVFDMESCQRRLSGGYVTLLFSVATSTDAGRELLSNAGVWSHLASMGNQPELDYMSRLVLTKIDLISDNFIPRDLLRSWMTTGSSHLQLFAVNLLRTVLKGADMANREPKSVAALSSATSAARSNDGCWEEWCIETLVTQLNGENPKVARAALSVLEEATQDEGCLRTLVLAKPDLIERSGARNLLMRFLSIPEGIQYLEDFGMVDCLVREWNDDDRTTTYAECVDSTWNAHVNEVEYPGDALDMGPVAERRGRSGIPSEVVIPIKTSTIPSYLLQDRLHDGPLDGCDMQLLLSLPWNIEVIVSRDSTPTSGFRLKVDTWVDATPKDEASRGDKSVTGTAGSTTMVVHGILLDASGKPACYPLDAHLTLHARLCVGTCGVDRRGSVQWHSTSPIDKQTAPFGRNRPNRTSRSPWSPQHARADNSAYGSNTIYRGVQGIQDFGSGRDIADDPSDMEHQLFWSTCRPHQRMAPPPRVVAPGSDNGKDGGRPDLGLRTLSPLPNSLHDEALDAVDREDLGPSDVGGVNDQSVASAHGGGCERVVRVPHETARWVFANQPQPEDVIPIQVVENASVTYLKAVEMTICLKDVGPSVVPLPPHIYGELAKTERGCELLRKHVDLKNLLHTARDAGVAADARKGALWALAHVCSWPLGLTLVEEHQDDVISMLLSMSTSESHLSVWGTSYCVVSLVARTARGRSAIRAAGWESARDPSTSVYLPQDPTVLFQPVPWAFEGSLTQVLDEQPGDPVIDRLWKDLSVQEADILHHVAKLSSHISRKEAIKKLGRMRKDKTHKQLFTNSLPVFLLVHQFLADYSFSLPMRRYISELFDKVTSSSVDWEPFLA